MTTVTRAEQITLRMFLMQCMHASAGFPVVGSQHDRGSCVCNRTRAQFREDCRLLPLLLAVTPPTGGRFVELGALDGLSGSNTYALETCLPYRVEGLAH